MGAVWNLVEDVSRYRVSEVGGLRRYQFSSDPISTETISWTEQETKAKGTKEAKTDEYIATDRESID